MKKVILALFLLFLFANAMTAVIEWTDDAPNNWVVWSESAAWTDGGP